MVGRAARMGTIEILGCKKLKGRDHSEDLGVSRSVMFE
jgi:hypothetical protein